ncbi:DUF6193 family natural product biosynthesis protein [Streptomyces longwoodensis]|uniref:Uncharacterized protein n=1 Tax=Streptomyces lasalocidi TaxID=324833 RepID=B5M9M0_STRLS|nr:DUF6193 family natural product biosynthesis protein [Streptomyces lasalocidi]TKS98846.1 hypothetical protein E4U91_01025 [Streptomyces lasalocidi]BAG85037.1 hypothetical protein [Streptomyces lasalocidi]CAQ64698.1 hypothetical protein [Streptomyces lasalocidi]
MNPDLYPDLVAAGGLGAALEQLAAGLGVEFTVVPQEGRTSRSAGIASSVRERGPLSVHIAAEERFFLVSGWSEGIESVTGGTPDPAEVVLAGAAWGQGTPLRELEARFPFLRVGERAKAAEHGPAAVVALQWRTLRRRAAGAPDVPGFGDLVTAAHAEPRLRQLYVFSSHWTLGFSSCTGYPFRTEVAIAPALGGSPYRVMQRPHRTAIGEAATAGEAVAFAASRLPAGLGPAVAGTAEDG